MRKILLILLCLLIPLSAQELDGESAENAQPLVSQKIPNLRMIRGGNIMDELQNTVWVTLDVKNDMTLYAFFSDNKYGNTGVLPDTELALPSVFYPMRFLQAGNQEHSSIFIIASKQKLLYYTMYLIDPYHLVISAGYNSPDPLLEMTLEEYLRDGFVLQLVY